MSSKVVYALRGLWGRMTQRRKCGCCGLMDYTVVDRKGPYVLCECKQCMILFCYPTQSPRAMTRFYQHAYRQPGLTTDLPDDAALQQLLDVGFQGTAKDDSSIVEIFRAIGVEAGSKVLDFGANWGYTTYQLRRAGLDAVGYEISVPRAQFARKLGVDIQTQKNFSPHSFDVVFSSHVLEHVPDPLATLREQWDLLCPGGWLIGLTPNGGVERRQAAFESFHKSWGRVHPFLLTDRFLLKQFGDWPIYIASERYSQPIGDWNRSQSCRRSLIGGELLFIVHKQNEHQRSHS